MSKKSFDQGYACALSCIVSGHGADTSITEALAANGLDTEEKCRKAGVDEYDIEILKPAFRKPKTPTQSRLGRRRFW